MKTFFGALQFLNKNDIVISIRYKFTKYQFLSENANATVSWMISIS